MTDRELLARETAAILQADIHVRLGDGPITAGALKDALIESVRMLSRPLDTTAIIVERDPTDASRLNALVPPDWLLGKCPHCAGSGWPLYHNGRWGQPCDCPAARGTTRAEP
jgi:hypothetical protein